MIVRAADVRPEPWANGGGTTRELARADDGSWRISLADIGSDGPFSVLAGRHRVLTVVEGPDGALYALTSNRDGRGSPRDGRKLKRSASQ